MESNEGGREVHNLSSNQQFPKSALENALRSWWKRKTESPLCRKKPDARKTGGTVFDIQPEVSSLEVVQVLIEIEKIVGIKLNSDIVKRGGYGSCEEFTRHLMSGVEARVNAENSKTTRSVGTSSERTRAHAG
jgi:hypothetical protein